MTTKKRIAAVVGLVLVGFGAMALLGHRSSSAKALQAYKAELRARGEPLTYSELIKNRKPFTNDSIAVITNAVAGLPAIRAFLGTIEPMQSSGPGQAIVRWQQDVALTVGGTNVTWPDVGIALQQAETNLAMIRKALQDPARDMGIITNPFGLPRPFVAIRSATFALSTSALYHLHEQQLEQALADVEALAGLARLNRDDPTLVSQMIRVAVTGMGLATTWEALQAPGWSEAQLQRLQEAWAEVDLLDGVAKGFMGERVFCEGAFETLSSGNSSQGRSQFLPFFGGGKSSGRLDQHAFLALYRLTSIHDDELRYLKLMQSSIQTVRRAQTSSWAEITASATTNFLSVNPVTGPVQRYRYVLSSMAIPNNQMALKTTIEKQTLLELTRTAIALKRYSLENGHQAPDLESLIPRWLPVPPRDPYANATMKYKVSARGFLLYSVGADCKDDHGDANLDRPWLRPAAATNR